MRKLVCSPTRQHKALTLFALKTWIWCLPACFTPCPGELCARLERFFALIFFFLVLLFLRHAHNALKNVQPKRIIPSSCRCVSSWRVYASETVAELTVQLASTHICVDRASARARMLHCVNVRNRNNGAHIMVSSSCREDTVQKRRNFQTILVFSLGISYGIHTCRSCVIVADIARGGK